MSSIARFVYGAGISLTRHSSTNQNNRCLAAGSRKRGSGGSSRIKGRPGQSKQVRDNKRTLNDHYFLEAKRCNYLSRAAFKLKQVDEKYNILKRKTCILDLGCFPGAWLQVACEKLGPVDAGGLVVGIDLKEMNVPQYHCDGRVHVLNGDARDLCREAIHEFTAGKGFHTVLSDMCHDTMGAAMADVASSLSLCETAATIAIGNQYSISDDELQKLPRTVQMEFQQWRQGVLRPDGALVMKILEGADKNHCVDVSVAQDIMDVMACLPQVVHLLGTQCSECDDGAGSGTKEFADMLRPYFAKVAFLRPKATRKESREVYIVCKGHMRPAL